MTKVNVLPISSYPKELKPIVQVEYEHNLYKKYKNNCYRLGNTLYIFGNRVNQFDQSKITSIKSSNTKEAATFSSLLRRLVLNSLAATVDSNKFEITNRFIGSRVFVRKKEPSIKTDKVNVYEQLVLQSIHWKDTNYGIIATYKTRNQWSSDFREEINENDPPSYKNIWKYLSRDEAKSLIRKKIPKLRKEKESGKWRGDALKQRFEKVKKLISYSLDWHEGKKCVELPTQGSFKLAPEFIDVVPLG